MTQLGICPRCWGCICDAVSVYTRMFLFIGGDDFMPGPHEISFAAYTNFALWGCIIIETNDDNILEGNHDFIVDVDVAALAVGTDNRVTASGEFTVTITDSGDGEQ